MQLCCRLPPPPSLHCRTLLPRNYDEIMDQFSLHQFIIRKGKVLDNTPEFASYQRSYRAYWGSIERVIRCGWGGGRWKKETD